MIDPGLMQQALPAQPPAMPPGPDPMASALGAAVGGPPAGMETPPNIPPEAMGAPPMGMPPPEEKKPPLLLPPKLARELAEGYVEQVRSMAGMIAEQAGPPDDFQRFKLTEQVRAWNKRNPAVDPLALREQGLGPTEIRDKVYPLRRLMLKMVGPSPTDRAKYAARMKAETDKMSYDSSST